MPTRQYTVTYTARLTVDDTSVMTHVLGTPVLGQDGDQVSDDQDLAIKSQLMNQLGTEIPFAYILRQYLGSTFHSVEPAIAEALAQRLPAAQLVLPGSTVVQEEVTWHAKGEPGFADPPAT